MNDMTKRALAIAVPLVFLAACSDDSDTVYTLNTGTYAVSGATSAQALDTCGLLPAYQDATKRIGVTVAGADVIFNLANDADPDPDTLPRAVINGNAIEQATEADYNVSYKDGECVVRVRKSVTGEITGNDQSALTLTFSADIFAGNCAASDTSFTNLPCDSSYHFLANKVQ
jgi:hypothetical protein